MIVIELPKLLLLLLSASREVHLSISAKRLVLALLYRHSSYLIATGRSSKGKDTAIISQVDLQKIEAYSRAIAKES